MIGGSDFTFPTPAGALALRSTVRAIVDLWPNAVFEDADSETAPVTIDGLQFGTLKEVFAYRDSQSAMAWENDGATAEQFNAMIHLVASTNGMTIVVGDPAEPDISALLSAVRRTLVAESVPALVGAAA